VHYDKDTDKGNLRFGWACVLTNNDLAMGFAVRYAGLNRSFTAGLG
jgi:hypothetical protein